jgi:hypothetical protein
MRREVSERMIFENFKFICRVCQIGFCPDLASFIDFGTWADELYLGEALE